MIKKLKKALRDDINFYYGWQANIAIAFQDEYARSNKRYKNRQDVHDISNKAAQNFLNLLIKE